MNPEYSPWIIVLLGFVVELYALFVEIPRCSRLRKELMRIWIRQNEIKMAWKEKRISIGSEVIKLRERDQELRPEFVASVAWGYFFMLTGLAMMFSGSYLAMF